MLQCTMMAGPCPTEMVRGSVGRLMFGEGTEAEAWKVVQSRLEQWQA